jgi:hypothetical protein
VTDPTGRESHEEEAEEEGTSYLSGIRADLYEALAHAHPNVRRD